MNCRPASVLKLCQFPIPGRCCNSRSFHVASPRYFPYTTACQLNHPVVGYAAQDTALEQSPPSSTSRHFGLRTLLDALRALASR